ncbi:family 43 glycosylhydrolase [Pontibacter qinzhouensis]|uniref:Family 43 glycosylhydrolase n=1 Tax=Pontibacter qinzhouensis TaxID=2603253 RepID=A0A5C8K9I5_9BACT|nr:family 43 glycosylhydrolase [Pontibacter qinzhouensis]TXK49106.1 family 43 glycosylhydrolase [Pontibacter qinzhouensis]
MKKHFLLIFLSYWLFSCSSNTSDVATEDTATAGKVGGSYSNPVLPGDYADPSVVRVGEDYWATATSSEWAPLFPLLHSKDLVNWATVGHVFPESLPEWAEAHFWAPEIAHENGKYYIYYTAKKKGGNLCVGVASASSPTGPYTDHGPLICQEVGSIDGFEIRDENGDLYLVWKEDGNSRGLPTPIWAQRLNEDRTALTGEMFEMFRNDPNTWEGGLVEGSALVKRGEYFYHFYAGDACCGRDCTYGIGVARAKTLRGPWEKHPDNPIMQKNDDWKCPGHGTVVTDPGGQDYMLYHAYSTSASVYAGRQGMLDKVTYEESGWPSFETGSPAITAQLAHNTGGAPAKATEVQEEFTETALSQRWQWPVGQKPPFTLSAASEGTLALQASPANIGATLAQRTLQANYTATTAIRKSDLPAGTMAGLTAIGDQENAVGVAVSRQEILLWSVKGGRQETIAKAAAPNADAIQLRLTAQNGEQLTFAWSTDGNEWQELNGGKAVDAAYLPPWDRGVRVGLTAKGPASATATFNWFRMVNNK